MMLADAPLINDAQDRLGFPAYADALAGLLDHPDTADHCGVWVDR